MLQTLGWMSIRQRLIFNTCIFIHKLVLNEKPKLLAKKITRMENIHDYYTRSSSKINIKNTKTYTAEKCITYIGYNWYSNLPDFLRNESRIKYFRIALKEYIKNEIEL